MQRFVLPAVAVCICCLSGDDLMAAATLTTLHVFNDLDGHGPTERLVQATNGSFYGTTPYGGTGTNCIDGCGTVFEITPDGAFTSLHSFTNFDGSDPRGGLTLGSDGNLYGTTAGGGFMGPGGLGTVFRITPEGALTTLYSFVLANGGFVPEGDLIEASDGNFYGTTAGGGAGAGGMFRISTNGAFVQVVGLNQPVAGVIQARDGNFYGTTPFGGTGTNCVGGCGTIFRITPDGVLTTLHSFDGSDGKEPLGELVEGSDGNLYGTTSGGPLAALNCTGGCGTLFMITTNGVFTNLHAFVSADGRQPRAGLVEGADGSFYGTAFYGGASSFGTVFQITTNGAFTRLISFNALNGGGPAAALVLGDDGNFYGTTQGGGGTDGKGTVFKLTLQTNATGSASCVLSPGLATNVVGTSCSVVATVTSNGVARIGVIVNFSVITGPNVGRGGSAITGASGQASFSYTGALSAGIDTIRATSLGATGRATNVWITADSVGDGIPDWWRAQYFGGNGATTNDQSCATCDAVGTGQNNLFKYVAGLNPTNPASVFVLSARNVNGQPSEKDLTYGPIAAGRTYTLQFRTNLEGGAWAALTGFGGPTTNIDQVTVTDRSATEASRFYRIRISFP